MATSYKILAQSSPSAQSNTDIYTCPSATQTVVSSIVVANRSGDPAFFRIAIRQDGESIANKQYVSYDAMVLPNDSSFFTVGLTINASDIITVYSSSAELSFNVFGSEIS